MLFRSVSQSRYEAIVIEENKETETLEVNSQQILPNVDLKQNETSEVVRKEEIVEEKKPRMSTTTSSGKKILFNAPTNSTPVKSNGSTQKKPARSNTFTPYKK